MKPHNLNPDAQDLEEAFFAEENRILLEKLRQKAEREEKLAALQAAFQTDDRAFLERVLDLGVGPETVLAVTLVPLAMVAWADGALDDRERAAILRAAEERGTTPGTPARALLESWLARQPPATLFEAWKKYVQVVGKSMSAEDRERMRKSILDSTRKVAVASGGIMGLGPRISGSERAVLEDLERALPS